MTSVAGVMQVQGRGSECISGTTGEEKGGAFLAADHIFLVLVDHASGASACGQAGLAPEKVRREGGREEGECFLSRRSDFVCVVLLLERAEGCQYAFR